MDISPVERSLTDIACIIEEDTVQSRPLHPVRERQGRMLVLASTTQMSVLEPASQGTVSKTDIDPSVL